MVSGDREALERIFEADARFQGVRDGSQVRRGLAEFVSMVTVPEIESGVPTEMSMSVDLIHVTGSIAFVKVTDRFRGRTYVDYLTLVKSGARWRIVNKAFTTV